MTWDDALPATVEALETQLSAPHLASTRIIRDLYGRIAVVVPDEVGERTIETLRENISTVLGKYGARRDSLIQRYRDTLDGDSLQNDPRAILAPSSERIRVIDRLVSGSDWFLQPSMALEQSKRATFFSIKGGVGRSTTAAVTAWRLAMDGHKIIVLDLDLEAPGIGGMLLTRDRLPSHGIVDWLVEDGLGPVDAVFLRDMLAPSHLVEGSGELLVVPAYGSLSIKSGGSRQYLSKLGRAFVDVRREGRTESFSGRIDRLITNIEKVYKPKLVIIDSRAGLHEIAATTLLRLRSECFLFATDSMQTWDDYRFLLAHLQALAQSRSIDRENDWRSRLKMIHALASFKPEEQKPFVDRSQRLWADTLYDEAEADDQDAFNFDLNDPDGPHYPLRVFFEAGLRGLEFTEGVSPDLARLLEGNFGSFIDGFRTILELPAKLP